MKFKFLFFFPLLIFMAKPASSQNITGTYETAGKLIDGFSESLINTASNGILLQDTYADAFIGKLFPSSPAHFAFGIEGGITSLDFQKMSKTGKMLDFDSIPEKMYFPTISLNAKLGGFFLPFDIGLSFFTFDTNKLTAFPADSIIEFFSLGGELRYAILTGKKFLPKFSVGAGYFFSKGRIVYRKEGTELGSEYNINTYFLSAQISKTFIFITPFVGFRGILSDAQTKIFWKSNIQLPDEYGTLHASFSRNRNNDMWNSFIPQLFGGIGLKIPLIEITVNGSWDFRNSIWSAGGSLRLKI